MLEQLSFRLIFADSIPEGFDFSAPNSITYILPGKEKHYAAPYEFMEVFYDMLMTWDVQGIPATGVVGYCDPPARLTHCMDHWHRVIDLDQGGMRFCNPVSWDATKFSSRVTLRVHSQRYVNSSGVLVPWFY